MARLLSPEQINNSVEFYVKETVSIGDRICSLNYKDKHHPVAFFGEVIGICESKQDFLVELDNGETTVVPAYNLIKVVQFGS